MSSNHQNTVELLIGSQIYTGWKEVKVIPSISSIAGSFDLAMTDIKAKRVREVHEGDECQIKLNGELVIDGYIDDVLPFFDAKDHGVRVTGRDKTADLIDCSAVFDPGEWNKQTLLEIAKDVCAVYSVEVVADVDVGPAFKKFRLEPGESCFDLLDRAARMRGVLLIPNNGQLLITRAGTDVAPTALVEGVNIKGGNALRSYRDRYKTYIVKGQSDDEGFTEPGLSVGPSETVTDDDVTRERTLVILAEDAADATACEAQAIWERNVRRARSRRAEIVVQGWNHDKGLWRRNTLVPVKSEMLSINQELLIETISYTLNKDGTLATMNVVPAEAYEVLPLKEKKDDDPWL